MFGGFAWAYLDEGPGGVAAPVMTHTSVTPHHKLGLLVNVHCFADMQPWSKFVSGNGSHYGATGLDFAPLGAGSVGWEGDGGWAGLVRDATAQRVRAPGPPPR